METDLKQILIDLFKLGGKFLTIEPRVSGGMISFEFCTGLFQYNTPNFSNTQDALQVGLTEFNAKLDHYKQNSKTLSEGSYQSIDSVIAWLKDQRSKGAEKISVRIYSDDMRADAELIAQFNSKLSKKDFI